MDSFIFSINAVVPIFIVIFVGVLLRRRGLINDDYVRRSSQLVFNISLPLLIFVKISTSDLRAIQLGLPVTIFLLASLGIFGATWLAGHFLVQSGPARGALVQGAFRGNIAIIALPILANIVSPAALTTGVILLAAAMPVYNILAVIVLSVTADDEVKTSGRGVLLNIARNPLIVSVLLALLFALQAWRLPAVVMSAAQSLAQLTFPLALLGIGASMRRDRLAASAGVVLAGAVVKNVVVPLAVCVPAYACGIRGETLAALFVIGATPTAVSSFIMAKAMHADAEVAAGIVFVSTLLALPVLAVGIFLLRAAGMV